MGVLSVKKDIRVASNDSVEEKEKGISVTVSSALIPLKQASGK